MKLFIIITLSVLFLLPSSWADNAPVSQLVSNEDDDCLPVVNFGLADIRLYQSHQSVLKRLGQPNKITYGEGEDDGGGYKVTVLHYPLMTIDIVRGEVDRIITTHPQQPTPEGIRVGDSRADIIKKLGAKNRHWKASDTRLWIVTCFTEATPREDYLTYVMNGSDKLVEIIYEVNRP